MTEDEEADHIKETFAYFGRAFYAAGVVEAGLTNVLMQAEFLKKVHEEFVRTKGKGFDRKKYEADFDAYMENSFAQTMGNLIKRAQQFAEFTDDLKDRIVAAKKRRDFLVHHYWREMAVPFANSAGRTKMIEELDRDAKLFDELDDDIQNSIKPLRKRLGIKEEVIAAYVENIVAEARSGKIDK